MVNDTLELLLVRKKSTKYSTMGKLFIDKEFFCYSLEDVVRAEGIKIKGETAIPFGRYRVIISYSNRFKRRMPEIVGVPMFTGIRMHGGNTAKDTDGCPCVAYNMIDDNTIQGTAEKDLTKLIDKAGKETYINIV